jgi:cyclohexyl-isocyanide hydratase
MGMIPSMRWLFHVLRSEDVSWGSDGRYRPASLDREGFIHASYRDVVLESAGLYFPEGSDLRVFAIDPRRLDVPIDVVETPRGPMPHIRGPIPCDAVRVLHLDEVPDADRVKGTRIGLCAFAGMTLLDLVGPLDVLSRIASMGFDATASCEVIALTRPEDDPTVVDVIAWRGSGAALVVGRHRPALDVFDVLVVPGGPGARALLASDPSLPPYLASFPHNRLLASVCTGALLIGAADRLKGKRATTHASALDQLTTFGAIPVRARVVDEGSVVTAAGVTAGIDLGLHIVARLEGREVAEAIAERIEVRPSI